jgi:hypothetical protein
VVQPGAGCDGLVGREDIEMSFGGRQCDPGDPDYMCWRWATARKTGGAWYSTTAQGYNKTWRVAEVCYATPHAARYCVNGLAQHAASSSTQQEQPHQSQYQRLN